MTSSDLLLELFATDLADVRFPEVDATSLAAHHRAVDEATQALALAEQAVARASADLAERKQALAQHTKRALAYVKIYAEERPELRERVESMQGARKGNESQAGAKRPGRPRKQPADTLHATV